MYVERTYTLFFMLKFVIIKIDEDHETWTQRGEINARICFFII